MKRPTILYSSLSLAALAAATPALGQSPATTATADADTIIVTATRTPQPPQSVGSSVTVLSTADIQSAQSVPVVDLLRDVPGVAFSRNGGVGSVTSVRIRGAEADQTVVLIDGVKLNDPSQPGGGFNFANLLVGDLDRIEVLRGPQSTLYGSQAIGGVVNLISREARAPLEGDLNAEAGGLETRVLRAGVRGRAGQLHYGASAGRFESAGISSAAVGTEADSFENTGVQARASLDVSPTLNLEARGWWSWSDAGIDGFPAPTFSLADTPERSTTDEQILLAAATLTGLDGRWRTRLAASQTRTDRDSLNPTLTVPVTFTALGENERVELQTVFDATPRLQLLAGYEHETARYSTASPSSFNPTPVPSRASSDTGAFYAQAQFALHEGLVATLGVRQTDNDRFGTATNLRATVAATFNDGDTVLRAAGANGFKAPTLFQLFSDFGNRTLQPEEADSLEAGIEHSILDRRVTWSLTWFWRETTNQIDFISCFGNTAAICTGRPFGTYDNVARTEAEGFEATLEARPVDGLTLTAGYTSLEARNTARGTANFDRRLPRRPDATGFLTAAWSPLERLDLSATWSHVGESFDNASNTRVLDAYGLLTVRAAWRFNERFTLYGRVENASDETYQTATGYGSPPRQLFVGIRASL